MRIQEVYSEEEALALAIHLLALGLQPVDGMLSDGTIFMITLKHRAVHIALGPVAKAVLLERHGVFRDMPLTLESGVIASLAQHIAYRRQVARHIVDESIVRIVEHAGLGNMPTGIDNRARRGRDIRAGIMFLERSTYLAQSLASGIVATHRILLHIGLLVAGYKNNVVLAIGIRRWLN